MSNQLTYKNIYLQRNDKIKTVKIEINFLSSRNETQKRFVIPGESSNYKPWA